MKSGVAFRLSQFRCIYTTETFFKDIHLYSPQLKYLSFNAFEITDNALNSISKLKKLNKIVIQGEFDIDMSFTKDYLIHYLISRLPFILIQFPNETKITDKTIKKLIKLALKNLGFEYSVGFQEMIIENK